MKRYAFAVVAALSFALAAAAPAPAADLPGVMPLTGFETESAADFGSWHGGSSSIAVDVSAEQFHSGAKSLKVTSAQSDYCGCAVKITDDKANWAGYGKLAFWMLGSKSGVSVHVYIEEGGGEQFVAGVAVADDFTGWKEIVLPFSGFTSRTDYQAGDAKVDRILQVDKVKTVQFDTTTGTSTLYYDDLAVAK